MEDIYMALKDTVKHMRDLLANITQDLEKADAGNKAASQRVRTGTVRLEKIAKVYRKESIKNEKQTKGQRKPSASAKKASASKARKPAQSASRGAKSHPKAKQAQRSSRPHALSFKRATAKLPSKRAAK
jgi:DNA-binding protein H-NS